jgi:hypothetical protein
LLDFEVGEELREDLLGLEELLLVQSGRRGIRRLGQRLLKDFVGVTHHRLRPQDRVGDAGGEIHAHRRIGEGILGVRQVFEVGGVLLVERGASDLLVTTFSRPAVSTP